MMKDNIKKPKVLIGMSGGVDSSVAAVLLKDEGYDVIGVTMKLLNEEDNGTCCNLDSTLDAKRVCDFLEIPHYTLNFKDEFKKYVIDDFINSYKNLRTPNPCIECNKYLKFGAMYKKAKELGCDYIATGHYAKVEFSEKYNKNVIKKSDAIGKDQSYVLYSIDKQVLDSFLLPLGSFKTKSEIREIAKKYNLPVANKPDSEDICFITDGDYKKYLETHSDIKENIGNIVNKQGLVLGKHKGLYRYTIGQRRGLGVSYKEPLFVTGYNKDKNELIVGTEPETYTKEFMVSDLNWLLFDTLEQEMKVKVKVRYTAKECNATIIPIEDKVKVIFDEPQKYVTPGQSAVFYIDDIVIGGGKIE